MRKQCIMREKLISQVAHHVIKRKKYNEIEPYIKNFLKRFYVNFVRDIAILFVHEGYSFKRNEREYKKFCNDVIKEIIEIDRKTL